MFNKSTNSQEKQTKKVNTFSLLLVCILVANRNHWNQTKVKRRCLAKTNQNEILQTPNYKQTLYFLHADSSWNLCWRETFSESFNPNIYFWFFLTFCLVFVCSLSVLENSRVQRQFQTSWVLEDPTTTYSLITATWDPVEWWTSKHDSKFLIIKATLTQTVMCLFFHLEAPDFTTNTPLTVSFRQTSAHIHIHNNVYGSPSLKASLTRGKMTVCMSVGTKVPAVEQRHHHFLSSHYTDSCNPGCLWAYGKCCSHSDYWKQDEIISVLTHVCVWLRACSEDGGFIKS